MSHYGQFHVGAFLAPIETLTGNVGGAVGPTGAGNVNIVGTGAVVVTGDPVTNQMDIAISSGTYVETLTGNVGGAVGPDASGNIDILGSSYMEVTGIPASNSFVVDINDDAKIAAIGGWHGSIIEEVDLDVTSDGTTITFSVEKLGGGDLTVIFSDGFYTWDTTPLTTISLTPGTDTAPQRNFIYLLKSTKTLTVSTTGFPTAAEYAPLSVVLCQSAASVQTYGPYSFHGCVGEVVDSVDQGHITHLNCWIRYQNATWQSGVVPTLTITSHAAAIDDVIFTCTSGEVLHLHEHTFPAFSGTPDLYTVNDSVTPYNRITNLNTLLTDSSGNSMADRYFSLVIWGVVNEDTGDSKLMVNLPSGSYNSANNVKNDNKKKADYSIPSEFKGTGFLIAQYNLHHVTGFPPITYDSWTLINEIDLRGLFPSVSAGAGSIAGSEFDDSVFRIYDDGDYSKQIAFEASGITASTTRTLTVQDQDGTIALTGVAGYGTGATTFTDHGVLVGSGTSPITALAVGTKGQLLVGATGADPAFASTAAGSFSFSDGVNGGTLSLTVENSDPSAAAASDAAVHIVTDSGSDGDPYLDVGVDSGVRYCFGIDTTSSDSLKINSNAGTITPSSGTNYWKMTTSGERTMPLQPAFHAYLGTDDLNVTGNGTTFKLGSGNALTEAYDVNGDFNTNGTFTAPVTGKYRFSMDVYLGGITNATILSAFIVTSNRTYSFYFLRGTAVSGQDMQVSGSTLADMDAGDTAYVNIRATGEASDIDDVKSGSNDLTWFNGSLEF